MKIRSFAFYAVCAFGLLNVNSVNAQEPIISYKPSTNINAVGTFILTITPANSGGLMAAFAFALGVVLGITILSNLYRIGSHLSGNRFVANYEVFGSTLAINGRNIDFITIY